MKKSTIIILSSVIAVSIGSYMIYDFSQSIKDFNTDSPEFTKAMKESDQRIQSMFHGNTDSLEEYKRLVDSVAQFEADRLMKEAIEESKNP